MTDLTRSSTLSPRHLVTTPLASGSRPRPLVPVAPSSQGALPAVERGERVVSTESLLQGCNLISIMHNGEKYQLRATRLGKLILTK